MKIGRVSLSGIFKFTHIWGHYQMDKKLKIKILYVDNSYTFGGAIRCLVALVNELSKYNYEPILFVNRSYQFVNKKNDKVKAILDNWSPPWHFPNFYQYIRKRIKHKVIKKICSILYWVYWYIPKEILRAIRIYKIGKKYKVDIIHLNNGISIAGIVAAKLLQIPCICHMRGFETRSVFAKFSQFIVDYYIAISNAIKDNLIRLGIMPNKIILIPDFISELDEIKNGEELKIIKEFQIKPNEKLFGIFGRVLKFKGQKEFLMAAREVFKKVANCRAFIVGDHSDGPLEYYNELKSMIRDYSLTKKVILTGYRQDALEIMKCMDVVVLATRVPIEAFGRVIIEAMSLGKPVVATKCGGPADIIENGKNGYLIPMRDIKAMSNAIIKLLTEENIDNFKQAAKETVIKKFSAKVCIPKIDKIYRTLMNIKRQSKQVSH